ncbi:hypothetical protein HN385_06480 [archaeon]|jgi:hypothetical protein|nr:hypothetical protein [archaeon]MBT6869529.1 hypothetical protein [archaeon]MBT7193694.1 hypothetical protein [archaeon]MBT7380385.1 hypothetical protein [archaeon]MBT7508706.1 hypothetical protein [archaeon]
MFKNKKGAIAIEALVVLVTIVITSSVIFTLVSLGVVGVDESSAVAQSDLLNTEFLGMGRSGQIVVDNFRFCSSNGALSGCLIESYYFYPGDEVHFFFEVESSTYADEIMIVENYELIGPDGGIILSVEAENDYYYEMESSKSTELVYFKDYFTLGSRSSSGEYTLNLYLNNPLIDKSTTLTKTFNVINNY